jgi:hypothetical protein
MSKYWFVLILGLFPLQNNSAQVFCLPPDQPRYPYLLLKGGVSASFLVTFDVVGLSAKNIYIRTKDSVYRADDLVRFFSPPILEYLNRFCFIKDINNFSLIVDFEAKSHRSINRGYVEKVSEDRIRIVDRAPHKIVDTFGTPSLFFDCPCKENE